MPNPQQTLTDQDIAAIEAGVTLTAGTPSAEDTAALAAAQVAAAAQAEVDAAAAAATAAAEAQATADAAAAAAQDTAAAEAQAAADAAAAASASAAAAAAAATSQADVVSFLQSQVKEKDAALLETSMNLKTAETKLASVEATHTGLLAIARASIGNMQVALGGSAVDLAGSDALAVLAEHSRIATLFSDKFKAGRVSAASTTDKTAVADAPAVPSPLRAAQVGAVRIGSK